MSSQRPVLTPRGAQAMAPHRMDFLKNLEKSGVVGKEECDSGFHESSYKSEGGSFERELGSIVEETKNFSIDDSYTKRESEVLLAAPPAQPSTSSSEQNEIQAHSQPLSPESCVLNFAQCNDVRFLLAPMREYLLVQDEDGDTPLHLAIINMELKVVEAIVALLSPFPQFLDIFNYLRQSPLHLATITKQPMIVKGLIRYGATIDLVDRNGKTALHLACERGDEHSVQEILKPLSDQTFSKETREKCYWMLHTRDYEGFTALQRAVLSNSVLLIRRLLEGGADVNAHDGTSGKTALHHAVEAGNMRITSHLLFECQADVDAVTFDECTALHFAAGRGMEAMTGILIAAGADPLRMNRSGVTPQEEAHYSVQAMLHVSPTAF